MATAKQLITGTAGGAVLGAALILSTLFVMGAGPFSGVDGGPDTGPSDDGQSVRTGLSSTLKVATFDATKDGSSQVGSSVYAWKTDGSGEEIYLGSSDSAASSRASFSEFVTGDDYEVVAFDSTYDYGVAKTGDIDSETKLANLDTYEGAATSDIETTVYDSNGDSTSSVSLGADEQYSFSNMEVRVGASVVAYNPRLIAFSEPENLSDIEMPNAQEVEVPESMSDTYDVAFVPSFEGDNGNDVTASAGEAPSMMEWDSAETGNIVVSADSDGTSGETMNYAVADMAPYITESDDLGYGIEDDASSPSDVGVPLVTGSITLN